MRLEWTVAHCCPRSLVSWSAHFALSGGAGNREQRTGSPSANALLTQRPSNAVCEGANALLTTGHKHLQRATGKQLYIAMGSQSVSGSSAFHAALTGRDQFEAPTQAEGPKRGNPTMIATLSFDQDYQQAVAAVSNATVQLHRSELALHDAHGSHVDSWIAAASNKLHETVVRYENAQTALALFTSVAA